MLWITVGALIVIVALLVFYTQNVDEQRRLDISVLQLEVKVLERKIDEYHPDSAMFEVEKMNKLLEEDKNDQ